MWIWKIYGKYIIYMYIFIDADMEIMKDTPGAMLGIPEVINGGLVNCKHIGWNHVLLR